jgi:hypothetical protein
MAGADIMTLEIRHPEIVSGSMPHFAHILEGRGMDAETSSA